MVKYFTDVFFFYVTKRLLDLDQTLNCSIRLTKVKSPLNSLYNHTYM